MKKIEKGTHKGLFDWILESDKNATSLENISDIIRVLVNEHNSLIDSLQKTYQEGFNHGYDNGKEDSKL